MEPSYEDLERLVYPFMRIGEGMKRAQKRAMDPTRLTILRQAATKGQVRPSEIAAELGVHQSSITRQTRALEDAGHVRLDADPADRRSCLISLTEAGWDEVRELTKVGLDRFAEFLEGWDIEDVRTLGTLLTRLEASVTEAAKRTQRPRGRSWQKTPESESGD